MDIHNYIDVRSNLLMSMNRICEAIFFMSPHVFFLWHFTKKKKNEKTLLMREEKSHIIAT